MTDQFVDAGRAATEHLIEVGCVPLLDRAVLQALWRRGGSDRAVAHRLYLLTRQEVA